jgi:hypothetical protein
MFTGSLTNYCIHHATVPVVSLPPLERMHVVHHVSDAAHKAEGGAGPQPHAE